MRGTKETKGMKKTKGMKWNEWDERIKGTK